MPKRDMFELQLIFAKHETRKLDSGLSFSFKNQKYRLPVNVVNNKVPASPHDTITVATSKYIGVQVLYKGLVIEPEPLKTKPKESIAQKPKQQDSLKGLPAHPQSKPKNKSPWFGYNKMFYSKRNRGDISAAQLSR
ncbi:MAG: hypothetical protein ACOX6F_02480 [Syntrophomonadaceae bacterium]